MTNHNGQQNLEVGEWALVTVSPRYDLAHRWGENRTFFATRTTSDHSRNICLVVPSTDPRGSFMWSLREGLGVDISQFTEPHVGWHVSMNYIDEIAYIEREQQAEAQVGETVYNPDDWQDGDIVLMEVNVDSLRFASADARERNRGPQVRMLVTEHRPGQTPRRMWRGPRGGIIHRFQSDALVSIQRLRTVSEEQFAAQPHPNVTITSGDGVTIHSATWTSYA